MMTIWIVLLCLVLMPGAFGLTIEGNDVLGGAEIRAALTASGDDDRSAELIALYDSYGYLDTEIEISDDIVSIVEGPRYSLSAVEISGSSDITQKDVYFAIGVERGKPISNTTIRLSLEKYLAAKRDDGYLFANATYNLKSGGDPESTGVLLNVDLGLQYRVGEITIVGANMFESDIIKREMNTRQGRALSQNLLAADMLTIIDMYRSAGYPYVTARPGNFSLIPEIAEIDFTITVIENARTFFGGTSVSGNKRSRDNTILRELTFNEGDPYDVREVNRSIRSIYALKYFRERPEIVLADEAFGAIEIVVVERPTYLVSGALGYEPGYGDDDGHLLGEVEANLDNLFGTGRNLYIRYYQPSAELMEADGSYYEPYIGGVDLFAQPSGSYKERTTYRKATGELLLGTHITPELTLSGGGGYERVWEADASRKYKAIGETRFDSRDYFLNPRTGWEGTLRGELGLKTYYEDGFTQQVPLVEINAIRYQPLGRLFVIATRVYSGGVFASRISIDEYFGLGGAVNLRGYRYEQFLAEKFALGSVEMRYLPVRDARLIAFCDAAYYPGSDTDDSGYGVGYGVGFRARTRVGLYGVDYALGRGDAPLEGKVHITVAAEF